MKKRVFTGLILIFLTIIVFCLKFLLIPSIIVFLLLSLEILKRKPWNFWTYLAFYQSCGIFLINIIAIEKIFFIALIVIFLDSASYIGGKFCNFGKFKKHPFKISPHKTYGGYIYGFLSIILLTIVLNYILEFNFNTNIFKTILIGIAACLGDILNSKFKRTHQIKNSGEGLITEKLFNGHGGAYDRFDSISLALIAGLIIL